MLPGENLDVSDDWTKILDSHSLINSSSGMFVARVNGKKAGKILRQGWKGRERARTQNGIVRCSPVLNIVV